jgi:hypothetical protein
MILIIIFFFSFVFFFERRRCVTLGAFYGREETVSGEKDGGMCVCVCVCFIRVFYEQCILRLYVRIALLLYMYTSSCVSEREKKHLSLSIKKKPRSIRMRYHRSTHI